jgi:ribosome maturation factor RimP
MVDRLIFAEHKDLYELICKQMDFLGFYIVRLHYLSGKKRSTLQVMIERKDDKSITVEDCEQASNYISAILDVEDPIKGEYNLELSSAGLDRPLTRMEDFAKNSGFTAKIKLYELVENLGTVEGELVGIDDQDIMINIIKSSQPHAIRINIDNVKSAKLVINDKLLKSYKSE